MSERELFSTMVPVKYEFDPNRLDFEPAYRELRQYVERHADASHTWGYFPELNPNPKEYPACTALTQSLETELFAPHPNLSEHNYKLAFIRVATAEPQSQYGGMHVDVHAGVGHSRDVTTTPNQEIMRLLLNPHSFPRKLGYVALSREELGERGTSVSRDKYQVLDIPEDVSMDTVEIPPIEEGTIYGVQFCSSQIPHAGMTDSRGHYLIAYGAYTATP